MKAEDRAREDAGDGGRKAQVLFEDGSLVEAGKELVSILKAGVVLVLIFLPKHINTAHLLEELSAESQTGAIEETKLAICEDVNELALSSESY